MVNAMMLFKLATSLIKCTWNHLLRGCVKDCFSRQAVGNRVEGRKEGKKENSFIHWLLSFTSKRFILGSIDPTQSRDLYAWVLSGPVTQEVPRERGERYLAWVLLGRICIKLVRVSPELVALM